MEAGQDFRDESKIVFVNSTVRDASTELGRLMHDFHCKNAAEMYSDVLAKRVYELKETQKGAEYMCREMDKIFNEGKAEGLLEGKAEGLLEGKTEGLLEGKIEQAKETARNMKTKNFSDNTIAEILKVSVQMVQNWLAEPAPTT